MNILATVAEQLVSSPNRPDVEVAFDGTPVGCPILTVAAPFESSIEVTQATTPAGYARFELVLVGDDMTSTETEQLEVIVQKVADADALTCSIWSWLDRLS